MQKAFIAATQQGQSTVRWHGIQWFVEVEPVTEFGTLGFFAFHHLGAHHAVLVQVFTQLANQFRIFGKALHQNLACTIQHGFGIGKAGLDVEVLFGFRFWCEFGVVE